MQWELQKRNYNDIKTQRTEERNRKTRRCGAAPAEFAALHLKSATSGESSETELRLQQPVADCHPRTAIRVPQQYVLVEVAGQLLPQKKGSPLAANQVCLPLPKASEVNRRLAALHRQSGYAAHLIAIRDAAVILPPWQMATG
jgi:hypothetical protein